MAESLPTEQKGHVSVSRTGVKGTLEHKVVCPEGKTAVELHEMVDNAWAAFMHSEKQREAVENGEYRMPEGWGQEEGGETCQQSSSPSPL